MISLWLGLNLQSVSASCNQSNFLLDFWNVDKANPQIMSLIRWFWLMSHAIFYSGISRIPCGTSMLVIVFMARVIHNSSSSEEFDLLWLDILAYLHLTADLKDFNCACHYILQVSFPHQWHLDHYTLTEWFHVRHITIIWIRASYAIVSTFFSYSKEGENNKKMSRCCWKLHLIDLNFPVKRK